MACILHVIGEWAEPRGKLVDRVSQCHRLTVYQMTSSLAHRMLSKIVGHNKLGERGHAGNYKSSTSIYGPILQQILRYYMKDADTRGMCSARGWYVYRLQYFSQKPEKEESTCQS